MGGGGVRGGGGGGSNHLTEVAKSKSRTPTYMGKGNAIQPPPILGPFAYQTPRASPAFAFLCVDLLSPGGSLIPFLALLWLGCCCFG